MTNIAIQVNKLAKKYYIGGGVDGSQRLGEQTLRELLSNRLNTPWQRASKLLRGQLSHAIQMEQSIWALDDVSFTIERGEVVGIIGRNGAGKSTLLKILSQITGPTHGEAIIYGRINSLIGVGAGFHQELTGRENVFLNGAILGMRHTEILRCFDEIVAFSEVEAFIDTPVKHYSSGMRMRLAFAVAAHLEPEILLIDEVLAVGDLQFQKKCLRKVEDMADRGRTVLLVSHSMMTISALCSRALYLKAGKLTVDGSCEDCVAMYLADVQPDEWLPIADRTDRTGSGQVRITEIRWLDAKTLEPLGAITSGQGVYLEVSYQAAPDYQKPLTDLEVNITFRAQANRYVFALNSRMAGNDFAQQLPATGQLYCHLEQFPLMPGQFVSNAQLKLNGAVADRVRNALTTDVAVGDFFGTGVLSHQIQQSVYVAHHWSSEQP